MVWCHVKYPTLFYHLWAKCPNMAGAGVVCPTDVVLSHDFSSSCDWKDGRSRRWFSHCKHNIQVFNVNQVQAVLLYKYIYPSAQSEGAAIIFKDIGR